MDQWHSAELEAVAMRGVGGYQQAFFLVMMSKALGI